MGVGAWSAAIPLAFLCKQQENEQLPGVPGCDTGIPGCLASCRVQSRDSCTILPNPSTKDLSVPQSYSELTYTNQSGLESQLEVLCKKPSVLWLG